MKRKNDVLMLSVFQWTKKKSAAALALAEGKTQQQVAAELNVSDRTIRRWVADADFSGEVDHLSLMSGIANSAERLRLAKRVTRQKVSDEGVETERDLLDWLKFAQSETDGSKLKISIEQAHAWIAEAAQAGGLPWIEPKELPVTTS